MKLKLFTAATELVAANTLIKELKNFKPTDMVYILTPDNCAISLEEEVIETLKINGYLNFEIITLDILVNMLTKQNFLGKKPMSSFVASVVIKNIILKSIGEFKFFQKAGSNLSFATEIYKTILQIKSSNITASQLKQTAQKLNGAAGLKFFDIALVYERYEDYLSGTFDGPSKFKQGAQNIKTSKLVEDSYFAFVHHSSLTALGTDILKELIKHSKGVLVSARNNINKATSVNDVYYITINICDELGLKPSVINTTKENNTNFKIFKAKNVYDEVLNAALVIKKELKQNRLKDMTLVVNNLPIYKSTIEEVFSVLNIPIFINQTKKLSDFAISKFVLGLISVLRNEFDSEKVIVLFKNMFSGLDSFVAMQLENHILKRAITGSMFFDKKYFDDYQCFYTDFLKPLHSEYENFKKCKDCSNYTQVLIKILNDLQIQQKNNKFIESEANEEEKEVLSVSFKKAMEILDELASFSLPTDISTVEFEILIKTAFLKCELNLAPSIKPALYVCDNDVSFISKNKIGFILGACDGNFPITQQDVGLVSDEEIKQADVYAKIEPSIKKLNKLNVEKIDELLTKFETCYISFAQIAQGEDKRASLVLYNLKEKFGAEEEEVDTNKLETLKGFLNEDLTKSLAKRIWFKMFNKKVSQKRVMDDKLANALGSIFYSDKEFKMFDEMFVVHADKETFFKDNKFSVTKLEQFFTCPLKHFLEKVLNLKERELGKIENVDIGNIYHIFLDRLLKYLIKAGELDEKRLKIATEKIMNDILKDPQYEDVLNLKQNQFILKNIKEEQYKLAYNLYVHFTKSKFKPNEKSLEAKLPENEFKNTGLVLTGKIDRVDYLEDKFRIIDYKTKQSGKTFSLSSVYYGTELQLPTYTNVLSEDKNINPAGMFFYPVVNRGAENEFTAKLSGPILSEFSVCQNMDEDLEPGKSSKIVNAWFTKEGKPHGVVKLMLTEKEFKDVLLYATDVLESGVLEALTGNIKPSVINDATCKYCPFFTMGKCFGREVREKLDVDKTSFKQEVKYE